MAACPLPLPLKQLPLPPPPQATHLAENALGVLKHVKDGVDLFNGNALLGQVVKGLHNHAIGALAQQLLDLKARVVNVPGRILALHAKRGLRHGVAARGDRVQGCNVRVRCSAASTAATMRAVLLLHFCR